MRPGPFLFPRALLGALSLLAAAPRAAHAEPAGGQPWAVVGRVVDELRLPVPGADVVVCVGEREAFGRTGEDGRFRVPCNAPPLDQDYAALRATRDDRVGLASFGVDPVQLPVVDVRTIVIRPGVPLDVRVAGLLGPAAGARVFAMVDWEGELPDPWAPRTERWAGWAFRGVTDARGVLRFPSVPPGEARVLAFADGPRRGEAGVEVGEAGGEAVVMLEAARSVSVTVVDQRRGDPVVGVGVGIERTSVDGLGHRTRGDAWDSPLSSLPTDDTGTTVLPPLPIDRAFALYAFGPGWVWPDSASLEATLEPRERALRIGVPALGRFTAILGEPRLPEGTRVRLLPFSRGIEGWRKLRGLPANSATVVGDRLVLLARAGGVATAELADGRRAHAWFHPNSVQPVRFVPPARLEVRVRDERGRPAPQMGVTVLESNGRQARNHGAVTDAEGRAVFEGLVDEETQVLLTPNADFIETLRLWIGSIRSGPVDLRSGNAHVEMTVPARRHAIVRVRFDGRPGLPPRFSFRVCQWGPGFTGYEPPDAVVDTERGEIRFTATWPKPSTSPRYLGDGLLATLRSPRTAPCWVWLREETPGGTLIGDLDCERAGALAVVADRARDLEWNPILQTRFGGEWGNALRRGPLEDESVRGRRTWKDLAPGEYRVHDASSGILSEVVRVRAGAEVTAHLDLRSSGYADVSVVDAKHDRVADARLVAEGEDMLPTTWYAWDGRVRLRVPGDRPVTIRVESIGRVAVASTSSIVVQEPRSYEFLFVPK